MAEVVNSLFGITPESLQAQRDAALQTQALQYAQLDPFQRATASIYAGANKLGGAIGGMLGAQDPAMAQATQRQALLQQARPQDANGWRNLAKQLWEAKDVQGAQEALTKAQAFEAADLEKRKTESIIAKNTADQKAAATPARIQEAETIAAYKQVLRTLKAGEQTPDVLASIKVYEDKLAALESPAKAPDFGDAREAIAAELFENKTFAQLTPPQKAIVNKRVQENAKDTTPRFSFSPEIQLTSKELEWRKQFLNENNPVVTQGASVRQSLNLLDQNTPFAQAAFNNTVVSAFGGDKQKSNAEIKRLVNTGALDTRIANVITNFFEGKTTATTVEDQRTVLRAVDQALEARYTSSSKGWEARLTKAKVDPALVVPTYEEVVGGKSAAGEPATFKGAPAKIISRNPDGTVVIEQNGVRKKLTPKN